MPKMIEKFAVYCLAITGTCLPVLIVNAEVFELGGLYTYHYHDGRYADWGDFALQGAHVAINEINQSGLLNGDQIRLKPENTIDYHCWPENAALMAETLMQKNILVLTGNGCSGPAVEIANVAARYKVPVISNGANASTLSSSRDFPWFVRVVAPSEAYEGYLIDLAAHFGVTEIAFFHTTDAWGLGARKVIREYTQRHRISILKEYGFPRDTPYKTIEQYMLEVRDAGIRHIVITGPTPDTVTVFRALHALDMNKRGYSFYAAEMISADESADAVNGSLGYFAPMAKLEEGDRQRQFQKALEERLKRTIDPNAKAFFYGALSYDHIFAVANAIRAIRDDGENVNRKNMMRYLREMDFEGLTGRIKLAPGTNDRAHMPLQIFNSHGYKPDGVTVNFLSVGTIDPVNGELLLDESRILWPGATRIAPNAAEGNADRD